MKRRATGIVAAFLLATVGTFLMVVYVQSAKDKAVAGEKLVDVYVVTKAIDAGTPADEVEKAVARKSVAAKALAQGAVTDLERIDDLVAGVDLVPGEQLLVSRFVTEEEQARGNVPAELMEVTVSLDPARALGGAVRAGDKVGVVLSFEPFDIAGVITDAQGIPLAEGALPQLPDNAKTPNTSHLELRKVLVTAVAAEGKIEEPDEDDAKEGKPSQAPTGRLLVTLAVAPEDVEQVVFAAEYGTVWLSGETDDVPEGGTRIVTRGNVYEREAAR